MNSRKLTLLFTALVGLAASAFAQTTQTHATVASVTGVATVTLPDGNTSPLTAGMKVGQGATITTGADGDVFLESHAGYVTSIKKNSTVRVEEVSVTTEGGNVTKENTTMDLKSGNLVALLDPKKKAVNNYQVRTPKGVAAARGTTFSVGYFGGRATVAVINGVVTLDAGYGGYSLGAGQAVQNGRQMTLAQFVASYPDEVTALVASVAVAAEKGIGGGTSNDLKAVLANVLQAAPQLAAKIASTVQQYAPTQTTVVTESVSVNAPNQSTVVKEAIKNPTTTKPNTIDPSTVSRSNE